MNGFLFFLLLQTPAFAQVNLYDFTQSLGAYSEITGGVVAGTATGITGATSLDDLNYTLAANTIPFSFNFDGVAYTSCIISTNGYITFGATAPTTTIYTPLSSTVAYSGAASAMGGNLNAYFFTGNAAQTGEIRYQTLGTSPNRVFVVQYKNFKTFATSGTTFGPVLNFQIRLSETTNAIDYVYNVSGSFSTASLQVGIRGANNTFPTNVKNRTVVSTTNTWAASVPGTANTSTCQVSSTTIPVAGQVFHFAPTSCPSPTSLNVSSVTTTSAVLGWLNPVAGGTFTVEYGPAGFTPGTGIITTTATNSVSVSGLSVATNYSFYVQKTCGVGSNSLNIGPFNFSSGSLGEDCSTAPSVSVAASLAACSFTLVNTGFSINGPASLCSDVTGNQATNDKWYKFVAPSTGSKLVITTQAGTVNDWVMEVWSGCPGGTGVVMKCGDDQNAFMPEIQLCQNEYTAGQTYYVRVWTYTPGAVGNMNLCVYQTAGCAIAPVNDNCTTATRLSINSPFACPGNATVGTTLYSTSNTDIASCDATTGKLDVWYVFNTGSFSDLNITISNITSTNVKAQLIFECGGLEIACWNPANGTHLVTGLNPVADYILRVWTDAAGAGTFNVCVSDVCSNPTATISGSQSICTGQSTTIPVTFTGVAPFTFVYSNGTNNQTITTPSNPYSLIVTPTALTNYSLVSMTDAACSGTATGTHTVSVIVPLNATLNVFSPVCSNAPLQTLTGGSPAGGVYSGVGVSGTTFNPAVGTQTITYTVTYVSGCSKSASQSFVVNALPTVSLSSLGTVCLNDPAITLNSGTPAGGNYSGIGVSNNIFTPSVAGVGAKTITYSYTTVQGCFNSDTAQIVVNSCVVVCTNPPTANAGVDKIICANASTSIAGIIGGSATTLAWSGGTGTYSPSVASASITYTPSASEIAAGSAKLILTANDPDGTGPCVAATDTVIVIISAMPSVGVISGATSVCKSQTGLAYSVVNQVGMNYNWTVPTGANIVSGQGTNAVVVDFTASAISGSIGVTGSNSCGTVNTSLTVTINSAPSATQISGSTSVCYNQVGVVYSVPAQAGMTYAWTVPSGVTITTGQGTNSITTTWAVTTLTGNVSLQIGNSCGVINSSVSVSVATLPTTPTITGSTLICGVQTAITYTVASQSGTYTWTVPANVTITSGQGTNTIVTSWAAGALSGNVGISISTSCGTTTGSLTVTKSNAPTTPTVTGTSNVCPNATGVVYSVVAQSGVTYLWTVPANVTITAGQGTNSITTTWSATAASGNVGVALSNSCGTASNTYSVTLGAAPSSTTITGSTLICGVQTAITYTVVSQSGSTYTWTVPANVTITSGQGTNTIVTSWAAGALSGNVGISISTSCGTTTGSLAVTKSNAPTTPTVTGTASLCAGATAITYSVTAQTGVTYAWTVPANVTITAGQGTNSITTTWNATAASGNVGVTLSNSCGTASNTYAVTLGTAPSSTTIAGTSNVCPNATGVVYSVVAQSGVTYLWTVPANVTITAGQGTNSITTTWSATAASGNVGVAISNTCGSTNPSFAVTIGAGVNIGSVSGPVNLCTPQTAVTYSVTAITGVTFTWTVPTGVTIVSGQGTNSIVTSWTVSAVTGNITVIGVNSCGSGSSSLPVSINQGFSVGTITGTTPVCRPATGVVYSVPSQVGVVFTWTVPANVTITAGQGTSSITTTWSSTSTSGNVSVSATGGCGTATASYSVVVRTAIPTAALTITGNASACRGDVLKYTIAKVATADYYNWIPSVGMLVNGSSVAINVPDTFVTVTFLSTYLSDTLKVRSGNCKGLSTTTRTKLIALSTALPTTPGTVVGPINSLCGLVNATYSFATAVSGAISYTWRTDIVGALLNGQATTVTISAPTQSVVLTFPTNWTGTGNLFLKANSGCGSSAEKTIALTSRLPAAAVVNGLVAQCTGAVNQAYSIAAISGATSYTWTIPSGVTLVSGQGTTSVLVNFNATAANRSLKVVANNACGAGASKTLVVAVAVCKIVREGSLSNLTNVEVYPNPTKGIVSVNFNCAANDNYMLSVSDVSGRVLRMIPIVSTEGENKVTFELSDVSSGVYFLTLKGSNDVSQTKIIVE